MDFLIYIAGVVNSAVYSEEQKARLLHDAGIYGLQIVELMQTLALNELI